MNDTLRDVISTAMDSTEAPAGDLDAVIRRGRNRRRRQQGAIAAGLASVAIVVGFGIVQPGGDNVPNQEPEGPWTPSYVPVAAFDPTEGLRAFADPAQDGPIHLGDRSYQKRDMDYLDTDASATPYGVVFFDRDQKPRLLGSDGRVVPLGEGPRRPHKGFHPSSKYDSERPWVAWTEHHGDYVRIIVYDLKSRTNVGARDVDCAGTSCAAVKVDGLDDSVAFVRTEGGTFIWRPESDDWIRFGGPELRVADVRGGTLIHDGPAPTLETDEWRIVKAPIDAQLTFDGQNILYWSNVLEPAVPGGQTIRLEAGAVDGGWYTIDTDGSILVASTTERSREDSHLEADFFDCEIPSGSCTKIGAIATESGDPMFIGDDM
jgi:hypothetical protein